MTEGQRYAFHLLKSIKDAVVTWAVELVNWDKNDWARILFSEESKFSVRLDNRRALMSCEARKQNKKLFAPRRPQRY